MKSAGTISISIALRSIVVSIFGVVLMFMTSPLLSALTLACLPARARAGRPRERRRRPALAACVQGLRAARAQSPAWSRRGPASVSACLWTLSAVPGLRSAAAWQPSMRAQPTDSKHTGEQLASGVAVRGSPARAAQVLLASFRVYSGLNRKYISEQLTSSAEASTVAEETFGSIRTVTRAPLCGLPIRPRQGQPGCC